MPSLENEAFEDQNSKTGPWSKLRCMLQCAVGLSCGFAAGDGTQMVNQIWDQYFEQTPVSKREPGIASSLSSCLSVVAFVCLFMCVDLFCKYFHVVDMGLLLCKV